MRKKMLILILLCFNLIGKAQIISDTIFVNYSQTTYIVFASTVDFFDVNPKDQYSYTADGTTIFIKTKVENAKPANYLAKCTNNEYYQGVVMYKYPLRRIFYDFRNVTHEVVTTTTVTTKVNDKNKTEPIDTGLIIVRDRFNSFRNETPKIKTVAIIENNLFFSITNLKHDKEVTYLKFKVINRSNIPYTLDYVQFEITEKQKILRNEIKPILENSDKIFHPKSEAYLSFVVPILSIPENCELRVTLRERNGLRKVTLYIPSKTILYASSY